MHDVISPVTEQVAATVPATTVEETDAAIERAHLAFASWRAVSSSNRPEPSPRCRSISRNRSSRARKSPT